MSFSITKRPIHSQLLLEKLKNPKAGAIAVFEGWVRNNNEGKTVTSLEYQIYPALAIKEGEKIIQEVYEKYAVEGAVAIHRSGHLSLGDTAVWVATTARHRDTAFKATRYIIDEIKHRLPIWKKEYYLDYPSEWVYCSHHH